jgi:hypothetical protein
LTALDSWNESEQGQWLALIEGAFINLATVGGICGADGNPELSGSADTVETEFGDEHIEWHFGQMSIDSGAISLLANLCEWGAMRIAPATTIEIVPGRYTMNAEPTERPLPEQLRVASFAVELHEQENESIQLQAQFHSALTAKHISQINHLLKPWHHAVFSGGFALTQLPIEQSEVRLGDPPLTIVDNLWCWNFEKYLARPESTNVLVNILERVHRTVCPISLLTAE